MSLRRSINLIECVCGGDGGFIWNIIIYEIIYGIQEGYYELGKSINDK